jgi:hypothetical protein
VSGAVRGHTQHTNGSHHHKIGPRHHQLNVAAPPPPNAAGAARPQNFLASIFEAQYGRMLALADGSATLLGAIMDVLNLAFTGYFTLELLINAYAHWLRVFLSSGWNHLDVFIVFVSLVDLGPIDIPTWPARPPAPAPRAPARTPAHMPARDSAGQRGRSSPPPATGQPCA